jgi:hypothetical protein
VVTVDRKRRKIDWKGGRGACTVEWEREERERERERESARQRNLFFFSLTHFAFRFLFLSIQSFLKHWRCEFTRCRYVRIMIREEEEARKKRKRSGSPLNSNATYR